MPERFVQGYGLVVGVGADLPSTVEDARAVADLLGDDARCAYPPDQVRLLTEGRAGRGQVLEALDWLAAAAGPEATSVVYFSGHGIEDPAYYLLPFGYDLAHLQDTCIPGPTFTEKLNAIQARKLLVALDCCHAGGIGELKGPAGTVSWRPAPLPPSAAEALGAGRGRVILASSRRDEVSLAGSPYSAFTAALLEALAGYGAFEQDGYARVLDAAMWVGRAVPERTADRQHPIVKVRDLADNFALAYYAGGSKEPRPLPWTPATLPTAPRAVEAGGEAQALRRMLANYRQNLLLIEERMSEYVEFSGVPLQLVREQRRTASKIAELERVLGIPSPQASP